MQKIWQMIESLTRAVLRGTSRVIGREFSDSTVDTLLQFIKFGIVGVSNTLVHYLVYAASLLAFQRMGVFASTDYLIAQIIAFALSVLWSFYWNNKKVFQVAEGEKRSILGALVKTYVSYSFTGLFLNSVLLILWVRVLHISEFVAPIINVIIGLPINFIINKFWAFK